MREFNTNDGNLFFSLRDITPKGWMKQQMLDDVQHGFAACLDEISPRASSEAFTGKKVEDSTTSDQDMTEDTPNSWWDGETQAVWWDGLIRMAYLSGDQDAIAKVDGIMSELLNSLDDSGYIGIYDPKWRFAHDDENGEFWTQSRALVAMLAYYELSGRDEYLEAVEKAMQLTMQHYGPQKSYFDVKRPAGGTCHGLMIVDALEWLFRLTGNDAYRDFGVWCYDDYSATQQVRDTDNQLQHLLRLEEGFMWHTPHTTEHLRVPLWSWYVSGGAKSKKAAQNAFAKIERYLTPSGACIGSESVKNLPPLPDMTYEYCAITELLTSLQSAYQKTGKTYFADRAEWLAFNAAQGSRLADGTAINYMGLDNRFQATLEGNGGRRKFSPTHEDVAVCCNPNAVKLLPYYTNRMWLRLKDDKGVYAVCYGPSELSTNIRGTDVTISEETDFPFSEDIVFKITPDTPIEFEFRMRIPGWAKDYTLSVTDGIVEKGDGFCSVRKTWQKGDEVTISFVTEIEPVIACNGEAGVRRGPLLYALPIAGKNEVLKEYGIRGLTDTVVTPAQELPQFRIDPDDLAFAKASDVDADPSRPWHRSPVVLKGSMQDLDGKDQPVTLEPFGCTILRQTMFESTIHDPAGAPIDNLKALCDPVSHNPS